MINVSSIVALHATLGGTDVRGLSVAGIGDLDGDTVPDIVVGASYDDDGGRDFWRSRELIRPPP